MGRRGEREGRSDELVVGSMYATMTGALVAEWQAQRVREASFKRYYPLQGLSCRSLMLEEREGEPLRSSLRQKE